MEIEPDTISFSRTNVRDTLDIRNDGGETLNWRARNWPDWVVLDSLYGAVPPGEVFRLSLLSDLAFGNDTGSYVDSIVFRSDGGNPAAILLLSIDVRIPPNGTYSGTTSEGLAISFRISYDRILDFYAHYIQSGELKVRNLPIYGPITYNDDNFTSTGRLGSDLIGVFDGNRSINGTWRLQAGRDILFNVIRTN